MYVKQDCFNEQHLAVFHKIHELIRNTKDTRLNVNSFIKKIVDEINKVEKGKFWNSIITLDFEKDLLKQNDEFLNALNNASRFDNVGELCFTLNIKNIPLMRNKIYSIGMDVNLYKPSGVSNLEYDDLDDHEWNYVNTINSIVKPDFFSKLIKFNNEDNGLHKQMLLSSAFWDSFCFSIVKRYYQLNNIRGNYKVVAGITSVYNIS